MTHEGSPIRLKQAIRQWGLELGFSAVGFAPADPLDDLAYRNWLAAGYHGDMDYMARNLDKRPQPGELLPGTRTVISVRLDYGAADLPAPGPDTAVVSRYALGRDYHKAMRNRLQKLADRIAATTGPFRYRAYADSAPVMEVELAALAGLGWRGKHTLLLSRTGSWYFLAELYCDLDLPADEAEANHCGNCTACLTSCPTEAFVAPYVLDARRCISYLTIEHPGSIPEELRPAIGTRIYGCDDCQAACPWNRFSTPATVADFLPRQGLEDSRLADLFAWTEAEFDARLAGSPVRRIGHERWLRNLAVALGNAPRSEANRRALLSRRAHPSALVREHVAWALDRFATIAP
ncbi:tRNA epoxyqueuosine(34) reductase QueG [Parasulfuritortus cantonensis]|uniref:tRNA epoxyqueuosine(34) reductase QueG n=1 Tax=Parasulfuritortus cantonensis TaxID=2528202 RepID=UPI001F0D16FF|nr:tRNA epoxyqueuosine(34) reductase QueG [Parasulfuritortus cantonensis]